MHCFKPYGTAEFQAKSVKSRFVCVLWCENAYMKRENFFFVFLLLLLLLLLLFKDVHHWPVSDFKRTCPLI
jgi:hypothetical protein